MVDDPQGLTPDRARLPRMAWAAWVIAAALLVGLTAAVLSHLNGGGSNHGMSMSRPMSDSFYRIGGDPTGSLMSRNLLTAWQLDPVAVAVLVLVAAAYLTGVVQARRREPWPLPYTVSFLAGLIVCGLATNSSIAVYDMSLFTAHMIGHLMLVMLAPALLMAGRPFNLLLAATTGARHDRIEAALLGRTVSLLTSPPVALASYTVVIVGTHLTGLMDQIMRYTWAGQVEHLAYVLLGCQFFIVVIGDPPLRWKLGVPIRFALLALSMAVDTFTGVVLLQSTTAIHMSPPPGANIDPVSDTQTGGAIMWFAGDGIMAVIMVIMAIGWIYRTEPDRQVFDGWLEQVRQANFASHAGAGTALEESDDSGVHARFDSDDARLEQYNEWLRKLNSTS